MDIISNPQRNILWGKQHPRKAEITRRYQYGQNVQIVMRAYGHPAPEQGYAWISPIVGTYSERIAEMHRQARTYTARLSFLGARLVAASLSDDGKTLVQRYDDGSQFTISLSEEIQ